MAVVVKDQKYQGDSAMLISILIWLNFFVPKIFEKQYLAVAKTRSVAA
jgi:hypothetical protein